MAATRSDMHRPSPEQVREVERYPDRGLTAAASMAHEQACSVIKDVLRTNLSPEHVIAGKLNFYPERGNVEHFRLPDVMVTLSAGEWDPVVGGLRVTYRVWDEVGPPDLVMVFPSTDMVGRDETGTQADYARYGVREYVQFDPMGMLLRPNLLVWRLEGDHYVIVPAEKGGAIPSAVSEGLEWVQVGDFVRLRDIATGALLPTKVESIRARADAEAACADAVAARAESEAVGRRIAEAWAAAEAARADAEAVRADSEAAARQLMMEELARLRAENARLRDSVPPVGGPPVG